MVFILIFLRQTMSLANSVAAILLFQITIIIIIIIIINR